MGTGTLIVCLILAFVGGLVTGIAGLLLVLIYSADAADSEHQNNEMRRMMRKGDI